MAWVPFCGNVGIDLVVKKVVVFMVTLTFNSSNNFNKSVDFSNKYDYLNLCENKYT
jgi:hypothetical protein